MFSSILPTVSSIKEKVPFVRQVNLNFITIHYVYIILWAIIGSVVVYAGGELAYIDALFFASGAATQSGLNTVDFNKLRTYQQVFLYWISMFTTPIFIHSFVVFVRLYWFEKRFQHVVQDARAMRRTKSRSRTATAGKDLDDNEAVERGVRGRSIVVLRNRSGEAGRSIEHQHVVKPEPESPSESSESPHGTRQRYEDAEGEENEKDAGTEEEVSQSESGTRSHSRNVSGLRIPTQLSPEHHIAFLENQRRDKGALRIPSPREYDRGGLPQALEDDPDALARIDTRLSGQSSRNENREDGNGPSPINPHITINEPDFPRQRSRTTTFPRLDTRRTMRDEEGDDMQLEQSRTTRRSRFNTLVRSFTQERERETMPYLSWNATIGRNSNFVDLTEEQRNELGGIEYRALKTLAVVLISYYFLFHILGVICLVPWIMHSKTYGSIVTGDGQGRPWWGIFTAASAFNDVGFTLTPDSMNSFYTAIFPLLLLAFLVIIGNTGFPCMLRLIIWVMTKVVSKGSPIWEELVFLLDHPRRCFTLLFPRNATWWLFAILVILNAVDVIFFIVLDLNDPSVTSIPGGIRFIDGLFQAASTRTAGFGVVSLSDLHPAIQVSYLIMMYISVFPIAISMRRTNVYEERSLGIYSAADEEDEGDDHSKEPSYIGAHLRRQLSFDLWYVFLGLFVISIVEGSRLQNTNEFAFTLFSVLFEIVSAYGTVGLSLGYPNVNASFSSQFKVLSKLVIIAMQIRGRHRGLPYALDRAILLPSESLHKKDAAEAEKRLRRRSSNVSGMSGVPMRTSTALSTARDMDTQSLQQQSLQQRILPDQSTT
ncbi:low affinity potassium transporter [Paecilomyces lecythidis]|uniref:Potassium transport protein n=1 Tax=Paecilomyces lecythidis TaxID=3004212 RepID=A0ABR3X4S0_9EURO